jgi:hypothetical protein
MSVRIHGPSLTATVRAVGDTVYMLITAQRRFPRGAEITHRTPTTLRSISMTHPALNKDTAKRKAKAKAKPKADSNHAANLALRACDYAVAIISADLSPLAKGVLTAAFNEAHKAALKEIRK